MSFVLFVFLLRPPFSDPFLQVFPRPPTSGRGTRSRISSSLWKPLHPPHQKERDSVFLFLFQRERVRRVTSVRSRARPWLEKPTESGGRASVFDRAEIRRVLNGAFVRYRVSSRRSEQSVSPFRALKRLGDLENHFSYSHHHSVSLEGYFFQILIESFFKPALILALTLHPLICLPKDDLIWLERVTHQVSTFCRCTFFCQVHWLPDRQRVTDGFEELQNGRRSRRRLRYRTFHQVGRDFT